MDFVKQFKAARHVSTPLIAIRTFDAHSTINLVRNQCIKKENVTKTGMIAWDAVHGLRAIPGTKGETVLAKLAGADGVQITVSFTEALRVLEHADSSDDVIAFFHNAHLQMNEAEQKQAVWNLRDDFKANGNMLVLLCSPGATLPEELVNDIFVMDEPLPSAEQLEGIVRECFKSAKVDKPGSETVSKAVDALTGLASFAADQATAMCLDNASGKLDVHELWSRKRQIISQTPGCSVHEGSETLADVAGLESVVSFLKKRMNGKNPPKALLFMDEVEKAFAGTGTDMSGVKTELTGSFCTWFDDGKEGIQFVGVPGVSKSALAKALGNEFNIPLIIYDLAGMQSQFIGSSNANLRSAQKMVNAISSGRVLVISTCNSIDSLPPEIRRRLQSLGVFFFDTPTDNEKDAIWNLYRNKYGIDKTEKTPSAKGWTGAEIKECCRKADILGMTLEESASYIVPVTVSAADRIRNLRLTSSGKFLSASKPGIYYHTETEIASPAKMPVESTGRKFRNEETA